MLWNKLTPYAKDDQVTHNGIVYKALANTMATPGLSSAWEEVGKSLGEIKQDIKESSDNFNIAKLYSKGDTVTYRNTVYKATKNTIGTNPSDSDAWDDIRAIPVTPEQINLDAPHYKSSEMYSEGDMVQDQGKIYKALKNTLSGRINDGSIWEPISEIKQSEVNTPIKDVLIKTKDVSLITVIQHGFDGKDGLNGLRGPKGETGDTGAQGIQGAKGDEGPAGPKGARGEKGETGAQGAQGIQGPAGPVKDRFIIGSSGYRNKIITQGIGTSLILAENKHSTGLKSLKAGTNITITDDLAGTLTVASTGGGGGSIPLSTFSLIG